MTESQEPTTAHVANGDANGANGGDKKHMLAATVVEFGKPLELKTDVPIPTPSADQILVKITASSLCMSDIAGWSGYVGPPPYCAGHEPVGIISELGSSVRGFSVGDKVGFMPASSACKTCDDCIAGHHRFCEKRINVGFATSYGGFSEYCLADPASTAVIPEGLSDEAAAPLLCAGVTAYAAVKKVSQFQPGGTAINVVGSGGVGHLVIMYAKAMGYKVHAFDVNDEKLQLATDSGADKVFNSMTIKDEDIIALPSTIVVSGVAAAFKFGFKATSNRGRVIAIGVPHGDVPIDVMTMVLKHQSLIATNQGTLQELNEALQIAADHGIKPVYELRKIEDLNDGFQELIAGKVAGRLVYRLS